MSDSIEVTVLGSGTSAGVPMIGCHCPVCTSADPRDRRMRPSIVVSYDGPALGADGLPLPGGGVERHNILVDTTPELRLQAVRAGLDKISAVVYTHAHADHIFGLDDVRRFNTLLGRPLPLFAAADAMATLKQSFAYAFKPPEKVKNDALYRPELLPVVIEAGVGFELFGRVWTPVELVHGRFRVLGFRIGGFAYCTDCNEVPAASRAKLGGLEVLIIDGLRPRPHPTHLSFEQAVRVIGELLPPPQRAFFTHLSHDVKHGEIEAGLRAGVGVAYDGMKIEI